MWRWWTTDGNAQAWHNEVILITGGSSGIGEQITRQLAAHGDIQIIVVDIQPFNEPLPENAAFYKLDITDKISVKVVAETIRREYGHPTVLINNAGIAPGRPILAETEDEIQRCFDLNVVAMFTLTREFLPAMIENNHGHVVTMASIASFLGVASMVDYCCSKASALAFHEGLTQELKHKYNANGVKTSIFHPYWTRTSILRSLSRDDFPDSMLEPSDVARKITRHLVRGGSGQVIIPRTWSFVKLLRGFPSGLQERIRDSKANLIDESRG